MSREAFASLTPAVQDYVKEIYKLQAETGRAGTTPLARRLGVAPPSATAMLKKLAGLGLAEHEPYRGAVLTERGEAIAIEMIRHHRLLEQYLSTRLGLPLDALHAEADRLEHHLSETVEARIDEALGFPTHDPHGDPIPDADLRVDVGAGTTLASVEPGEQAIVRRVPDGDAELLRYLGELGLVPGETVTVRSVEPFGGPVTVTTGRGERPISRELAARIGVGAC
jgi:DtxR family transcriptional regulator, Mn-dependent transcriptional regulator